MVPFFWTLKMKTLILEIPYPETMVVDSPYTWNVKHIGVYDDIYKVYLLEHIVKWFQNSKNDGQFIIDSGMRMIEIVVDGLINSFNKNYLYDHYMKRELTHFLFGFRSSSGIELENYKFSYEVDCIGKKLGVVGESYVYDNEFCLVKSLIHNFTNNGYPSKDFEYKIVNK